MVLAVFTGKTQVLQTFLILGTFRLILAGYAVPTTGGVPMYRERWTLVLNLILGHGISTYKHGEVKFIAMDIERVQRLGSLVAIRIPGCRWLSPVSPAPTAFGFWWV